MDKENKKCEYDGLRITTLLYNGLIAIILFFVFMGGSTFIFLLAGKEIDNVDQMFIIAFSLGSSLTLFLLFTFMKGEYI